MKIEKFIKDLKALKKLGAEEIWFSNDEEGNCISQDATIDGYMPDIYEEGRHVVVIFPSNPY